MSNLRWRPEQLRGLIEAALGRVPEASAVHFWTWPGSGEAELIEGLRGLVRDVEEGPDELVSERRHRLRILPLAVLPTADEAPPEEAASGETGLGTGRELRILVGGPRPRLWPAWLGPVATVRPEALGPREQPKHPGELERLGRRMLEPLDDVEHRLLSELADIGEPALGLRGAAGLIPLEACRQALLERPHALAALERLLRGWGYLVPVSDAGPFDGKGADGEVLVRLPPFLRQHLVEEGRRPQQDSMERASPMAGPLGAELAAASRAWAGIRASAPAPNPDPTRAPEPGTDSRRRPTAAPARLKGWELKLVGPPVVRRILEGEPSSDEDREVSWRLHRALHCVAYLALAPDRRATRDELVTAIWPEGRPESVRRNFHPTLSEARRCLVGQGKARGKAILYRHGYYVLDPEMEWLLDRDRFRELLDRARSVENAESPAGQQVALESLQRAWKLYRGPLLEGLDADWLGPLREELYDAWIDMLRRIGHLATALGRDALGLDAYRSLILAEPFEERSHLAIMEIYGGQRRRDLVRQQFVRLQEALKELGVEPSPRTLERYHQLMG